MYRRLKECVIYNKILTKKRLYDTFESESDKYAVVIMRKIRKRTQALLENK